MNRHDHTVHTLGSGLLIRLSGLSLRSEFKGLKRIASNLLVVVLGVLLADVAMYLLPNAIAGFIYGTH